MFFFRLLIKIDLLFFCTQQLCLAPCKQRLIYWVFFVIPCPYWADFTNLYLLGSRVLHAITLHYYLTLFERKKQNSNWYIKYFADNQLFAFSKPVWFALWWISVMLVVVLYNYYTVLTMSSWFVVGFVCEAFRVMARKPMLVHHVHYAVLLLSFRV